MTGQDEGAVSSQHGASLEPQQRPELQANASTPPRQAVLPEAPVLSEYGQRALAKTDHRGRFAQQWAPRELPPAVHIRPATPPAIRGTQVIRWRQFDAAHVAPPGVHVRVELGDIRAYDIRDNHVTRLAWLVEDAADVEVCGADPRTIGRVITALRRAFAEVAA